METRFASTQVRLTKNFTNPPRKAFCHYGRDNEVKSDSFQGKYGPATPTRVPYGAHASVPCNNHEHI